MVHHWNLENAISERCLNTPTLEEEEEEEEEEERLLFGIGSSKLTKKIDQNLALSLNSKPNSQTIGEQFKVQPLQAYSFNPENYIVEHNSEANLPATQSWE